MFINKIQIQKSLSVLKDKLPTQSFAENLEPLLENAMHSFQWKYRSLKK